MIVQCVRCIVVSIQLCHYKTALLKYVMLPLLKRYPTYMYIAPQNYPTDTAPRISPHRQYPSDITPTNITTQTLPH